jgi:hypothetical protein
MRALPFLLALHLACAVPAEDAPPEEASPSCVDARDHSDLSWIEDNVLAPSCAAFSSCHQGNALSAGGLNLEPGLAVASLVDVPSELAPGMALVAPGSPEESYLLVILGHYGADDPRIDPSVGTMPASNDLLCPDKRDAIARWIAALPPS